MPSESDLRDLLQGPDPEGRGAIDLDAVLSRARRRRRPRVIAAQALGSVALVGALGTAVIVSLPQAAQETAMVAQDTSAGGDDADAAPFVDEYGMLKAAECGESPVDPPLIGWSVAVSPSPLAAPGEVGVTVTVGLDAPLPESGIATITVVTVIDDGVVVGHAFPVGASTPIGPGAGDPAPWEPVTWEAIAPVVGCDDLGSPLPAGSYQVVVRITYVADGGDEFGEPIWSEPTTIEIG